MITIMSASFLEILDQLPGRELHLNAGTLMFQRDDIVRSVYVVRTGRVHLLRRQEDGAVFILQRAGPGKLVAEASLLTKTYHCSAEAVEPSLLTIWPQAKIRALINRDKETALTYASHLAGEVRTARLRAEISSLRKVRDRLDAWLAWKEGSLPQKGEWHHLARELNVTPEALYREIARRGTMK